MSADLAPAEEGSENHQTDSRCQPGNNQNKEPNKELANYPAQRTPGRWDSKSSQWRREQWVSLATVDEHFSKGDIAKRGVNVL